MRTPHRLIASVLLTALAAAIPGGASLRAEDTASFSAARAPDTLPVVAEHRYRMLAKVRPLLFWISRDNVGGARIRWRGAEEGFGVDLLIGSDPDRAPRRINRWGFIAEQVNAGEARVIGVMKQSNEQSIAEAQSRMENERRDGYVYLAIQGTATADEAHSGVTAVRVERDLTFRDIDPLLALVRAHEDASAGKARRVALPHGTKPGFLVALNDLVTASVDAYAREADAPFTPPRTPTPYVYHGVFYDLRMKSSAFLRTAAIDGHEYANLGRSDFEIRNRTTGDTTRFQLTYGTTGDLAGVPVHAIYQPRWWLEVQLFLDDHSAF